MWLIWNNVDALLTAFHTADVAADALLCSIEALSKQGDHIACVLLSISLNVSFNSASDSIVHGLVLLFIDVNFTSCFFVITLSSDTKLSVFRNVIVEVLSENSILISAGAAFSSKNKWYLEPFCEQASGTQLFGCLHGIHRKVLGSGIQHPGKARYSGCHCQPQIGKGCKGKQG